MDAPHRAPCHFGSLLSLLPSRRGVAAPPSLSLPTPPLVWPLAPLCPSQVGATDAAFQVWQQLRADGRTKPNVRTFTELIGACCKAGALDSSFGLLYQMLAEGVEPSRVTYDIMLRASCMSNLPYPTLPYLTLPYPTLPYLTLPYLTLPYPTLPYLTLPYLNLPYLTLPQVRPACLMRRAASTNSSI